MAQQTAVEYLLQKLYTEYRFSFSGTIVDEAKAMEKEQIKDAHFTASGYNTFDMPEDKINSAYNEAQEYYNKTYNK